MSNQRRLGRGLEALLGRSLEEPMQPAPLSQEPSAAPAAFVAGPEDEHLGVDDQGQRWLDLGVIEPNPYQPRKRFDEVEIADLADSIREHGVLQPLVVRRVDGRYQLVAGERRLRAAQAAGWRRVPVQLRELDERQTAEIAIVENVQRTDLNAIEKASGFRRYLDQYGGTQEDLAKRIHLDRSTVANLLRLLELPERVRQMVVDGDLSQGHARALAALADERSQTELARRVANEGLSVRRTEEEVRRLADAAGEEGLRVVGADGVSRKAAPTRSEQLAFLEQQLRVALGTKVALTQTAKGSGRITIHFAGADEFERLRARLLATDTPSATGSL